MTKPVKMWMVTEGGKLEMWSAWFGEYYSPVFKTKQAARMVGSEVVQVEIREIKRRKK